VNPDLMLTPLPAGKLPPWLLRKILPSTAADASVLVGPGLGRDAAAIAIDDHIVVAKSDPITFASERGAAHLVEVNANDIACLGAVPRWMLVTALLPHGVTPADVLNQFAELREVCARRSVTLIGGHTEIVAGLAHPMLIGTMLGEPGPDGMLPPGQATAGDVLLLTKGLAIEGTALLAQEREDELRRVIGEDAVQAAAAMLTSPGISVVRDAALAREAGGVTALHDPTEGGFATAVRELGLVSGAGVAIERAALPIYPETQAVAAALGLDPLGLLASGALLIAARPDAVPAIVRRVTGGGIPIAVVGRLTENPEQFSLMDEDGERELPEFAVDEVARILSAPKRAAGGASAC
jgi:hydrogenase maturation factor